MTTTSANNPLKLLLLDSDASSVKDIQKQLATDGLVVVVNGIESCKQLSDELQKNAYDVVFVSDNARDCSGIVALNTAKKLAVATPVVILSEILHEENIINYLHHGAADYVLKSGLQRLSSVVKRVSGKTNNNTIVDYQHFFENAPDMMCSCDNEGYFMVINPAWEKTLGFHAADIIGKSYIQFVHPDDRRSAAAQFQKLFDVNSESPNLVSRFQTKSGELKWLHWKMVMHSAGTVDAIVRDVTEFKTRELQLSQTCVKLQKLNSVYKDDIAKKTLVAEQIRDSVIVTNLKGLIVSWNKGSEKIFGYTEKETVGKHIAMIYPEKDYKYILEEATNVFLEQGEKEFSLHMLRKSGEEFEARLKLEVTRDKEGNVNGMLGYAIDMGPVRPVEEEIAHPENVELTAAPQQHEQQLPDQQPEQYLEQQHTTSQQSQPEHTTNLPLETEPQAQQDLQPAVDQAPVAEQNAAAEPATAATSEEPKPEAEQQPAQFDQQQATSPVSLPSAEQAQENATNTVSEPAKDLALSYTRIEPTTESLTLETSEAPEQQFSVASPVQNELPPSAALEKTVDESFAAEPPDNTMEATGTDNDHQSPVAEDSTTTQTSAVFQDSVVNDGMTLDNNAEDIHIQNTVDLDDATQQQIVSEKVFVPRADGSKITIMYLEDNMNHICQVEKVLAQRKGYLLITTQEPEDWVDMAKQYLPALILLDMDLPDADAYALRKNLQEHDSLQHIPVVAVSTDASDAAVNSAKLAGFSDYLGKPVEADRLFNTIDTLLYSGKANAI